MPIGVDKPGHYLFYCGNCRTLMIQDGKTWQRATVDTENNSALVAQEQNSLVSKMLGGTKESVALVGGAVAIGLVASRLAPKIPALMESVRNMLPGAAPAIDQKDPEVYVVEKLADGSTRVVKEKASEVAAKAAAAEGAKIQAEAKGKPEAKPEVITPEVIS